MCSDLWGLERVVRGEGDVQNKDTTGIWAVGGTQNDSLPMEH